MTGSNSTEDLAYVAGIVDGEGWIGISKNNTSFTTRVSVVNTNLDLLNWLVDHFGGSIYHYPKRPRCKQYARWYVSSIQAVEFLSDILSYLKVKKTQAKIAIALEDMKIHFSIRRGKVHDSDYLILADDLNDRMHKLNLVGIGGSQ